MWCVAMAAATSLWISHIIVGCTAVSFSYHRDCTIINLMYHVAILHKKYLDKIERLMDHVAMCTAGGSYCFISNTTH